MNPPEGRVGMRGDDIAQRLLTFGARVIKMADALPKSLSAKHICGQVIRCSTSAGANYEEARGAESDKDFTHKLGICLKEMRETRYWLKIIVQTNLVPANRMRDLINESDELCRIIGKPIITSKNKRAKT